MVPPAPGLFSTITGCFHSSLMRSATRRADTSDEPPGGNPTTMRTARDGNSLCASAWVFSAANKRQAKNVLIAGRVYTRCAPQKSDGGNHDRNQARARARSRRDGREG